MDYGDRHIKNITYNFSTLKNKILDEYVISNPNQIKSATSNIGTFSTENDDIRFRTVPNSSWSIVDSQARELLEARGWTEEKFNSISQAERDHAIKCSSL